MKQFDYTIFLKDKVNIGRRFGKSGMITEFYLMKTVMLQHLGEYFNPEMKKKNQKKLNATLINYIAEKIKESNQECIS